MANEQNKGTQNTSTGSGSDSTAFSEFSEKNQDKSTNTGSTETGSSGIGGTGNTSPGSTGYSGTGSATTDRTGLSGTSSTSGSGSSTSSSSGTSNIGTSSSSSSNLGGSADSSTSSGGSTGLSVESAKETAKGLYDQAKSTAGQAFGAATQRATEALDEKKVTVASGLTSVADSIKQVSENLNMTTDEPNPIAETAAKYTNSLAAQIENLSGYFERKDVRDMVRDVESFARRNPAYFIGGAIALGFLAARFLKSSNPKQLRGGSGRTFSEGYDTGKALTAGDATPGSSQF